MLCFALAGTASAKTKTKTISSGNLANSIVGSPGDTPKLEFGKKGKIKDVNMSVRADYPHTENAVFELKGISGRPPDIVFGGVPAGADFGAGAKDCTGTPTTFDDQAPTPITAGTAPFAGAFQPEAPLSAANGLPSKRGWDLSINPPFQGSATLYCWSLEIKYKPKKK